MNTTFAIKQMMNASGVNASELSRLLGKSDRFISTTLSKGSTPRADTLADMAGNMGYSLVLVPCADVPESAIHIDGRAE
jgi:transcriptional regulator with XRE-family HTH domain